MMDERKPVLLTNDMRADRAEEVLLKFALTCGPAQVDEPLGDNIAFLLADLMHLCKREGHYFDALPRLARDHFEAELRGE